MGEPEGSLIAPLWIEEAKNAILSRVTGKTDGNITKDKGRRLDMPVGEILEGGKCLSQIKPIVRYTEIVDSAIVRDDENGIARTGNQNFGRATGNERGRVIGAYSLFFPKTHESFFTFKNSRR